MAKRFPLLLGTALLTLLMSHPALAQPARPVSAEELNARLGEAQADPRLADNLFKVGRKVAAVCAHCHGEGGNSLKPDVPNLAGQNSAYLLEQIRQFSEGQRKNVFMEGILKALNKDEKVGMVLFYTQQEVNTRSAANPVLVAKGKEHYEKACLSCHGADGRGNETMARIAGQQQHYLRISLKRYRDGSGIRVDPLMASATRKMSDAEINAVVAYMEAMK